MLLDHAGEALAGHRADAAAAFLHSQQQGDLVERRPELAEAELRTRLRIGRDAGGVVICGAAHQSGPENPEKPENAPLTRVDGLSDRRRCWLYGQSAQMF